MPTRPVTFPMAALWFGAALLLVAAPAPSRAEKLVQQIEVLSRRLSDEALLKGDAARGEPVTVDGQLVVPREQGRAPVVILMHGSDGPRSASVKGWQAHLNEQGIATFRLDSYSGRGVDGLSEDQDQFGQFGQLYDAYRAADVLAEHPRVDGSRIVLMGFSRGGISALFAAQARFHASFGPRTARIVAYLPFYAACNIELVNGEDVVPAPIRLFHGSADDWTLAAPCAAYVEQLRAAGKDAQITVYDGARHAFDNAFGAAYVYLDEAQTTRNCLRREVDGQLINAATGRPFRYTDACVERGVSIQYDGKATDDARIRVDALLREVFARP